MADAEIASLKADILASGLTTGELVAAAWASASTFRGSDMRGGANGARIRAPQNGWEAVSRSVASCALGPRGNSGNFNASGSTISMADLIVLAGSAAVEATAAAGSIEMTVPFSPGRTDATPEMTDVESFAPLEPKSDGFRNFVGKGDAQMAEHLLVDRAQLLTLSAPEMSVLVAGLRVLGANAGGSQHGVLTDRVGVLSNDFFMNLLDLSNVWSATTDGQDEFEARRDHRRSPLDRYSQRLGLWLSSQLRAIADVYASSDSGEKFVRIHCSMDKVMNLDRFDLANSSFPHVHLSLFGPGEHANEFLQPVSKLRLLLLP